MRATFAIVRGKTGHISAVFKHAVLALIIIMRIFPDLKMMHFFVYADHNGVIIHINAF